MMKYAITTAVVLSLISQVSGENVKPAIPTVTKVVIDIVAREAEPEPTKAPIVRGLRPRQLGALGRDETQFIAPDNTCAYVNAEESGHYQCSNEDLHCVFQTASGLNPGRALCCNLEEDYCAGITTCYGSKEIASMTGSTDTDDYALYCSATESPHCVTVSIYPSILDFYCDRSSSNQEKAWTTYDGQTREFTARYIKDGETQSQIVTDIMAPVVVSTTESTETSATETSEIETSTTEEPGPTTTTSESNDDDDGVPVAPIVGGVVGGVGAIALGVLAFFLYKRRKNRRLADENQQAVASYQPTPMMYNNEYHNDSGNGGYYNQNNNDYLKAGYGHQAQPVSYPNTTSSPSAMTDPRMSYMSGHSPNMYNSPPASTSPQPGMGMGVVHEAPSRPEEMRRNDPQELP